MMPAAAAALPAANRTAELMRTRQALLQQVASIDVMLANERNARRAELTAQYERALKDVFAVQDDITRSIVGALQVRLASGDVVGAAGARGGTSDLAAYDHYLRALERYRGRGAGLLDAERSLLAAVAALALAISGLAGLLWLSHWLAT
jgi:GNAT superfamily N-acetyltransferase